MGNHNHHAIGHLVARHGDVGFVVAELPAGAVEEARNGPIVLAVGEATGHAHKIMEPTSRIFRLGDKRYLIVERPAEVVQTDLTGRIGQVGDGYDLHGVGVLPAGTYEIFIEEDYVPAAPPRRVVD